jgi:peroxiredoxin
VRAFGVSQTMDDLLDTPVRSAFLVDATGVIRFAHLYDTDEVPDVNLLIEEARSLGVA